jgi:hypothetical protein
MTSLLNITIKDSLTQDIIENISIAGVLSNPPLNFLSLNESYESLKEMKAFYYINYYPGVMVCRSKKEYHTISIEESK